MNDDIDKTGRKRGDGINIPRGDLLTGIAGYDQETQADLIWLHGYTMEQLAGSRTALTEFLGCDWTTITRVWRGKYEADISQFMARVRHHRRKAEVGARTAFVPTIVTEKIERLCDVARDQGAIVMVSGPSGRSKTHAVQHWRHNNNHGRAIYVYAPEFGGYTTFLQRLARALGMSQRRNNYDLAASVENSIDYRNVLIVDEASHLIPTGRVTSLQTLEFIRGLHDRTGCGVVLVATEIFSQQLDAGKWCQWAEQLMGRVELHLKIPAEFSRREIADICCAFCDDPDPDLIKQARLIANARRGGVRELFRHLTRAAGAAEKLKEPLAARHLAAAYELSKQLIDIPKD